MKTFDIKIDEVSNEYLLFETDAPANYDGFGTIEITETHGPEKTRHVLIREEHASWQTARYASGNHRVTALEINPSLRVWLINKMYDRLLG